MPMFENLYISFLSAQEQRKQWISMIRTGNQINKHARIRSIHFVGLHGSIVNHPIPTIQSRDNPARFTPLGDVCAMC